MNDLRGLYNGSLAKASIVPIGNDVDLTERDVSEELNACQDCFGPRYSMLLSVAPWQFAIKRKAPERVTAAADTEHVVDFDFVYDITEPAIPESKTGIAPPIPDLDDMGNPETDSDGNETGKQPYHRVIGIVVRKGAMAKEWEVEGNRLYTDQMNPIVKYVAMVPVADIHGPFRLALETALAVDLVWRLQRDEQAARRLLAEANRYIAVALQTVTPFVNYPGIGLDIPEPLAEATA